MTTRLTTQQQEPQVSIDTAAVLRLLADCAESNCTSEDIRFLTTLRAQLSMIGKDLGYVTTLMEAVMEGRFRAYEHKSGKVCGNCNHFLRYMGHKGGFVSDEIPYSKGICELKATGCACSGCTYPSAIGNTVPGCRKFTPRGDNPIRYCKEELPCRTTR